ncbi:MAG: ParB/RepB/Spo0J family partition protein [Gammaproteobacteria bacterium]
MGGEKKRKGLGNLGIDILLSTPAKTVPEKSDEVPAASGLDYIPIDLVDRSPYQPRQTMTEEGLTELADSIRSQGLIQPIVVRKIANRYELIAGERRWRAAQKAGLSDIPAVIKEVNDESAAAMALIENLQREDLNPIEEAVAVSNLTKQFDWTHQEVADVLGKARATVSNMLRLLELPNEVRELMKQNKLTMGHARALLSLPANLQNQMALTIVAKNLTVRQAEQAIRKLISGDKKSAKSSNKDPNIQNLENVIADTLGAAVVIKQSASSKKGKIEIQYNDLDELDGILRKIGAQI